MCGIIACVGPRSAISPDRIDASLVRLHHRGPDSVGWKSVLLDWGTVHIGQTRLKIVDQNGFSMPYDYDYLGVTMAYNGEIYNWKELKNELQNGISYQSNCDAEIIARAWSAYRTDCLRVFNGMFGFVLVDRIRGEVFIARDRAGEKPIYYAKRGDYIYLSSEIKGLPTELIEAKCDDFNALEFDFSENTPFKDVYALKPGHCIYIKDKTFKIYPWWVYPKETNFDIKYNDALDEAESLVIDAVRLRTRAEVPIAVQLSGGLDSAIIQAIADCDRLYCVTFDADGVDNMPLANLAAKGHVVKPVTFTQDNMLFVLRDIAYHLDTPATWTACCQWFLNKQIAHDGAKIVISGEGADELAGGYSRYRILYWLQRMQIDLHLEAYASLITKVMGPQHETLTMMLNRGGRDTVAHSLGLVLENSGMHDYINAMARVEFYTTMQVLLRMADRMAAAWSLENRSPFLDYRLIELFGSLPSEYKITEHESKHILRDVARRLGVNNAIVNEVTKKGLFIPSSWRPDNGEGRLGKWDRKWFTKLMDKAWKDAFRLAA